MYTKPLRLRVFAAGVWFFNPFAVNTVGEEQMRVAMMLLFMALLGGCAAGTMMGSGQGGRAEDGRSYEVARADNLLAAAVNRTLVRDKRVRASDIRVSVCDSVVTLAGTVSSTRNAEHVVNLVRDVDGVKDVVNDLRISR
jgi:hypothetical protein